jgi:hypothetical protein
MRLLGAEAGASDLRPHAPSKALAEPMPNSAARLDHVGVGDVIDQGLPLPA